MTPLLLAILGTLAHADGDTPRLGPPSAEAGALVSGPCAAAVTPGTDPIYEPFAQLVNGLETAEAQCRADGYAHCDTSEVIPQQVAACLAGIDPTHVWLVGAGPSPNPPGVTKTGLMWRVLSMGNPITAVNIDARTGALISHTQSYRGHVSRHFRGQP